MGRKRIAEEAKWKATGPEQARAMVSYILITPLTINQWKTEEAEREKDVKALLAVGNTLNSSIHAASPKKKKTAPFSSSAPPSSPAPFSIFQQNINL